MPGAWPPPLVAALIAATRTSALQVYVGDGHPGADCPEQQEGPCCHLLAHTGTKTHHLVVDWSFGVFDAPKIVQHSRPFASGAGCHEVQSPSLQAVKSGEVQFSKQPSRAADVGHLATTAHHVHGRALQILPIASVCGLILSKATDLYKASREMSGAYLLEMVASLLLFLVSGPAVILLNKHIMREYHFHFPIVLSSLGNLLIMVVTRVSNALGCYSLKNPTMEWKRYVRVVLLLNIFNFGTQVMGMWSYLFVSVPEIQILKSATVVLTMVFAVIFVKEPSDCKLVLSIGVITIGTIVTAVFDSGNGRLVGSGTGAQVLGIILCILASTFEAAKSVCSQILMDGLPVFDGMFWCSPAFVMLAVIFVAALELRGLIHFEFSPALCGCLVVNAVLTGVIVLSSFWFVKLVGALSLKVVTQARTVGLILVSVFFFREQCTDIQYLGYTATVVGMGMYNFFKNQLVAKAKEGNQQGAVDDDKAGENKETSGQSQPESSKSR